MSWKLQLLQNPRFLSVCPATSAESGLQNKVRVSLRVLLHLCLKFTSLVEDQACVSSMHSFPFVSRYGTRPCLITGSRFPMWEGAPKTLKPSIRVPGVFVLLGHGLPASTGMLDSHQYIPLCTAGTRPSRLCRSAFSELREMQAVYPHRTLRLC